MSCVEGVSKAYSKKTHVTLNVLFHFKNNFVVLFKAKDDSSYKAS